MTTATLPLDAASLEPGELSMSALMRELNLQEKSAWLLVKLMNLLEKQRQQKGLGWSRAWNKYGLTVFRTHIQKIEADGDYFAPLLPLLKHFLADAPEPYATFVESLLSDPKRMAFTFYHNNTTEDGQQYEGLTLSLGRKVTDDPTKRDRLDIILEDRREEGRVDGVADRLRIYVCPWSTYQSKSFHPCEATAFSGETNELVQNLYRTAVAKYHLWKEDEARQWSHWSVRYIDYFGPRTFIPQGSSLI